MQSRKAPQGRKILSTMLLSSALAAVMVFGKPAFAEDQTWKVNMKDADIRAFISQVSDITGYSFVLDPNVKGRVTVVSNVSMNKDGIWELFLNVLHVNNYSAVRTGDVIKIVRTQNAKTEPLGLDQASHVKGAELITRVIPVQNTPAVELVPILRPMIPQYGHLAAITTSNSLLISDHADNVQRMVDIVNRIDSASNDDMDVIQLQNTWVGDILKMIEELSPGVQSAKAGKAGGSIRVVADEQGNRLIVRGDRDARMRIKTAVAQLDQPGRKGSGTHVVYLRHADAEKTAEVLKGILGQGGGGAGKKDAAAAAVVGGDITVQPDKSLNALVIKATPSETNEIKEIIKQLDVRRAQVLIEGAIVEISGDVSDALGVQWGFGDPEKGVGAVQLSAGGQLSISQLAAAAAARNDSSSATAATRLSGNISTSLADGITIGGGQRDAQGNIDYALLIQALSSNSHANLLSTPSIMTLDNEEASIVVGQNVPFITGQQTSTASLGTSFQPFNTIQRQDVGLTLKVVPQINEGDIVRLQVEQEVSSVVPKTDSSSSGAADIVTNKRSIKTTIVANDQQTIVLGGLVQDDASQTKKKVPLLGDIPVLGRLFRADSNRHEKRNLLVFLKPTIVRSSDRATEVTERKYGDVKAIEMEVSPDGRLKIKKSLYPEEVQEIFDGKRVPITPDK